MTEMHQVTAPAVSPDGNSMVFEWLDDLWTASTSGGEAVRVEKNLARECFPQFTPDGKRIVFSSDRSGSMQVFSIPASGGKAIQHTHQSEGNELECISPDSTHAIVRGIRERHGFRKTGLFVIDLTQDSREQCLFETSGDAASWSPDGSRVLFCTGGEQLFRKGYRGSRAAQIWEFDIPTGAFTPRVADSTEARLPTWHPDGKGFNYMSGRSGSMNLWSQRFGDPEPVAITRESGDGVFAGIPAADGTTFVFHRGFGLFCYRPKTDPAPVPISLWTREKIKDVSRIRSKISTTANADFSASMEQLVFSAAGELWIKDGPNGEAMRLTQTAAAESDVHFSPDGQWLYFLRDDGLSPNYFRAHLKDGILASEMPVSRGPRVKTRLKPSPDGKRIAWVEGNGDVFTAAADGSDAKLVFPCWDLPSMDWDPGGKWLAIAAEDQNANRDIWLASAEGSCKPLNLTLTPTFEGTPRWSPDGRCLVFSAKGSDGGKSILRKIDFGNGAPDHGLSEDRILQLVDSSKPLTTGGIEPTRVIWTADSKSLFFQNKDAADPNLYSIPIAGGTPTVMIAQRGVPIRMTADGSLLWRVNRLPAIFKDAKSISFPISISLERNRAELLTLGFRRIWRTLGERFYDASMNGTDWQSMREKYEPAAAMSRTSRQFDRTVSQLFGELNASHLSFLRKPWAGESGRKTAEKATSHPGLVFRDSQEDGPLEIKRVIPGSPVAMLANAPKTGEVVTRIAGQAVTRHSPLHAFLDGGEDKVLPMVIRAKDGKERVIELRCISYAKARALDLNEQEKSAREMVAKAGKFAYLRVRDMSMASFEALELAVYRESLDAEGIILDFRNNGGGREADRMLSLFCQPDHSFTIPRGGPRGYPEARRVHASWNGPLVVLCNESTFSNAEIFCHSMKSTGRALLVGTTTTGGVISAIKATIPDVGELQVPFRGWFETKNGKNLDLNGAVPDFPIALTPADSDAGHDPQLAKAIDLLHQQAVQAPKPAAPIYRK